MSKKYINPPITEAVCEFRLLPDTKWDLLTPGIIYEKVKDRFPIREQRSTSELEILQDPKGENIIRIPELLAFLNDDKTELIQIRSNLMTVNSLKPYTGWENFKPLIEFAFNSLRGSVDIKGLQRIGLRYINRIEIPGNSIKLEEYFEFRPYFGKKLPEDFVSFITGVELSYFEGRDLCKTQLTSVRSRTKDINTLILDIDYYLGKPNSIEVDRTVQWIENAHEQIEKIFEDCITDRLREIFGVKNVN